MSVCRHPHLTASRYRRLVGYLAVARMFRQVRASRPYAAAFMTRLVGDHRRVLAGRRDRRAVQRRSILAAVAGRRLHGLLGAYARSRPAPTAAS